MNTVAQQPQAVIESESEGKSALAKLPPEWVGPVAYFCTAKLYLIRTRMPLVTNINYWRSKGLRLDDFKAILRRLCDPEVAATHNFENQLMAEMASYVARAIRWRRRQVEIQMGREAHDKTALEREASHLAEMFDGRYDVDLME